MQLTFMRRAPHFSSNVVSVAQLLQPGFSRTAYSLTVAANRTARAYAPWPLVTAARQGEPAAVERKDLILEGLLLAEGGLSPRPHSAAQRTFSIDEQTCSVVPTVLKRADVHSSKLLIEQAGAAEGTVRQQGIVGHETDLAQVCALVQPFSIAARCRVEHEQGLAFIARGNFN